MKKIQNTLYTTTSKLFFSKYPFRVSFIANSNTHKKRDCDTYIEKFKKTTQSCNGRFSHRVNYEYSIQGYSNTFVAYFINDTDIDNWIALLIDNDIIISNITLPLDTLHSDLLRSDHRIVTRKSLFCHKFKWRLEFDNTDFINAKGEYDLFVHNWCDEVFKKTDLGVKYRVSSSMWREVLYLRDDDDVLLVKLTFGSALIKIEKAVILSNTNNNNNKEDTYESSIIQEVG